MRIRPHRINAENSPMTNFLIVCFPGTQILFPYTPEMALQLYSRHSLSRRIKLSALNWQRFFPELFNLNHPYSGDSAENKDFQRLFNLKSPYIVELYKPPFQPVQYSPYYFEMEYLSNGSIKSFLRVCAFALFLYHLFLSFFIFTFIRRTLLLSIQLQKQCPPEDRFWQILIDAARGIQGLNICQSVCSTRLIQCFINRELSTETSNQTTSLSVRMVRVYLISFFI